MKKLVESLSYLLELMSKQMVNLMLLPVLESSVMKYMTFIMTEYMWMFLSMYLFMMMGMDSYKLWEELGGMKFMLMMFVSMLMMGLMNYEYSKEKEMVYLNMGFLYLNLMTVMFFFSDYVEFILTWMNECSEMMSSWLNL